MLQLQRVSGIEAEVDWLYIWAGGKTTEKSDLLAAITSNEGQGEKFESYNNYMILQFHTDTTTTAMGFGGTWSECKQCDFENYFSE